MTILHARLFSPTHCRLSLKPQVIESVSGHVETGEPLPVRAPHSMDYPPTRWP